jgi:hemolysin III
LEKIAGERVQTIGEEIANSISHGIGALLSIVVTPFMIIQANQAGSVYDVIGASVFGTTMINLYLSSTLYHALSMTKARRLFQILDHAAIYLLIAGTYTPFTLGVLRGPWGWTLFGLIWGLALMGVLLKTLGRLWKGSYSTILYVAMGWIVVIAIKPFWELVPLWGIIWLGAGGFFYTLGVVFFVLDRIKYSHFVWHLFVVAGTACHVVAVMLYARGTFF